MATDTSMCAFRVKEGDCVPWNDYLKGNPNLVPVTGKVAAAIEAGKITVEAARICAQRDGDLEALVDSPPPPPAPPAPPAEETLPPDDAGDGNGVGEPAPGDFDLL